MPIRSVVLANEQFYHIYNRGVARQPTFLTNKDYERFLLCLFYYCYKNIPCRLSQFYQIPKKERENIFEILKKEDNKLVEIIAFCLMPNHFHLLLKQNEDKGISKFVKLFSDSYARYFNVKHNRIGSLYQGVFKAVRVENDEQLIHLIRYIHLNPLVSFIVQEKDFIGYPWSSLKMLFNGDNSLVNSAIIKEYFSSGQDYFKFVLDQASYAIELEKIKHLTLEENP